MTRRSLFATVAAAFTGKRAELKRGDIITIASVYRVNPPAFHRDAFVLTWPKIGRAITVRKPGRFAR